MKRVLIAAALGVSIVACGDTESDVESDVAAEDAAPVEQVAEVEPTDKPTDEPATEVPPTIEPVDDSATRANPIVRGNEWSATLGDDGSAILAVTMLDAKIGPEADALLKAQNQFNDDPAPGNIHVLIRPQVSGVGPLGDGLLTWDQTMWALVANGRPFDGEKFSSMVMPEPEFDGEIIPPGQIDGWIHFEVPETDDLMAVLLRETDRGGMWFLLK